MRVFIAVLFLIFGLQSWTKADDIRDFEIEGMSIGDSALDYFSKKEIKKNRQNYYNNNEILPVYIEDKVKFDIYSGVQFHYKSSDKNFKLVALEGILWFENNFEGCKKKQEEIDGEFKVMFSNTKRIDYGIKSHGQDKSGKSKFKTIEYLFKSGNSISIACYNWTKEMKYKDNLRIGISTKEFLTWINTKAYK